MTDHGPRRSGQRVRDERGAAVVEFIALAVLMLIPLIYLVMMMARLQAGSFAVSQAAREAGRAFVTAESGSDAAGRAQSAARIAFLDHSFDGTGRFSIACAATPGVRRAGRVETTATVRAAPPLPPARAREPSPMSAPVSATHLSTVDRFRGLP